MKTFSKLAECSARIPPKITLYGCLFKYNDVGHLLLLYLVLICCLQSKGTRISSRKQDDFVRLPKPQKLDKWVMAEEKWQTCWPKLHAETEYESQLTAIL